MLILRRRLGERIRIGESIRITVADIGGGAVRLGVECPRDVAIYREEVAAGDDRPARPAVVCLCGSTRFKAEYEDANRRETLAGRIVLSVGMLGHHEGLDMGGPTKAALDGLHLRKIDLADEVLVLDVEAHVCGRCGKICDPWRAPNVSACCQAATPRRPYIGESTRREIAYAESLGKRVRYLSRGE